MGIGRPIYLKWIRQDLDHDAFERVMVGEKWIPGLKINNEKMALVMKGMGQQKVLKITMKELTDLVNQDLLCLQESA